MGGGDFGCGRSDEATACSGEKKPAVLDNAAVTAAEITPMMPERTIRILLLGLLIAGGMLIPGNIPDIICANKPAIKSSEWACIGVPLGLVLMTGTFLILTLAEFLLRANPS